MKDRELASEKRIRKLTHGNLSRAIFSIALPMIGSHTFILAMDVIDGVFLGRLGSSSLAAATMGWSIIFLLTSFAAGLGIGTIAIVSRAYGERKFERAERIGGQAIYLGTIMAVLIGAAGILLSPFFLRMLGADAETLVIGNAYLRILFGGLFMMFFSFVGGAVFQGAGDTVTPMKITAFALLLNMVLDPLLIFGLFGFPRLEAAGAAWATVLSRTVGGAIMIHILMSGRNGVRITFRSLAPDWKLMRDILVIGFPGSLQLVLRSSSGVVMTKIAAMFGPVVIAVLGVGGRIFGLFLFPGFGFGGAAATLVGQNLGAGKPERAERAALLSAFYYLIFLIVAGVPVFVFASPLARFFNPEPEFAGMCAVFFRYIAVGSIALSGGLVLGRALQGAGETVHPMIMTGISLFAVQVPLAYALGIHFGYEERGIWIGNLVGGFVNAALVGWIFFKGNWKKKTV